MLFLVLCIVVVSLDSDSPAPGVRFIWLMLPLMSEVLKRSRGCKGVVVCSASTALVSFSMSFYVLAGGGCPTCYLGCLGGEPLGPSAFEHVQLCYFSHFVTSPVGVVQIHANIHGALPRLFGTICGCLQIFLTPIWQL